MVVRVRVTWTMGTGQPTSASSCWAWGSVQASSWGDTLDRGHHTQAEAGIYRDRVLPDIEPQPGPRPLVRLLAAAGLALLDHGGQAGQLLVRLLVVHLEAEEEIFFSTL